MITMNGDHVGGNIYGLISFTNCKRKFQNNFSWKSFILRTLQLLDITRRLDGNWNGNTHNWQIQDSYRKFIIEMTLSRVFSQSQLCISKTLQTTTYLQFFVFFLTNTSG